MSTYDEAIHRREQAHALYLKLRALGLDVHAERCASEAPGLRVVVEGSRSLNPDHADRLMQLVRANEAGLLEVLQDERDPDLTAGSPGSSDV